MTGPAYETPTPTPTPIVEQKRAAVARLFALRNEMAELLARFDAMITSTEDVDVSLLVPPVVLSLKKSRRYAIKSSAKELGYRQQLWASWVGLRTSEAIEQPGGWRKSKGMPSPWSQEACAERFEISDPTQISRWLHGRVSCRHLEQSLKRDVARMKAAGVQPLLK